MHKRDTLTPEKKILTAIFPCSSSSFNQVARRSLLAVSLATTRAAPRSTRKKTMPVLPGSTQRPRFPLRDMATVAFLSAAVWKASQKVRVGTESTRVTFRCFSIDGGRRRCRKKKQKRPVFFLAPRLFESQRRRCP